MKLVVVSQNGCNPCTKVKNFLTDEEVDFQVFNISEESSIIVDGVEFTQEDLGVMGTPVTILFDEGEEVARAYGFEESQLEVLISQL